MFLHFHAPNTLKISSSNYPKLPKICDFLVKPDFFINNFLLIENGLPRIAVFNFNWLYVPIPKTLFAWTLVWTRVIDFVPGNEGVNLNRDVTLVSSSIRKVSSLVINLPNCKILYKRWYSSVWLVKFVFVACSSSHSAGVGKQIWRELI